MLDVFNIDTSKSYSDEARLMKALTKHGLQDCSPMIVRNRSGRYTAVFASSVIRERTGNVMHAAHHGFKTIG